MANQALVLDCNMLGVIVDYQIHGDMITNVQPAQFLLERLPVLFPEPIVHRMMELIHDVLAKTGLGVYEIQQMKYEQARIYTARFVYLRPGIVRCKIQATAYELPKKSPRKTPRSLRFSLPGKHSSTD